MDLIGKSVRDVERKEVSAQYLRQTVDLQDHRWARIRPCRADIFLTGLAVIVDRYQRLVRTVPTHLVREFDRKSRRRESNRGYRSVFS